NIYEIALFHAERHTDESNFNLSLGGFVKTTSKCVAVCGDGVVTANEQCDDGPGNGQGYGVCQDNTDPLTACTYGGFCGDGEVEGDEVCDNGTNQSGHNDESDGACAPGCVLPTRCGDGAVQAAYGETCDDGLLDGSYGGCTAQCTFGPFCGDGKPNGGEQCDDGVNDGTTCSPTCTIPPRCGDNNVDPGEQCDDGGTQSGDGCSNLCQLETVCGDGKLEGSEQCDD